MVYSATRVIEALRGARAPGEPLVPPVSVSAVYRFVEADVPPIMEVKYGRENNPTTMLLERGLAVAEEADWCLAFNSGMAAIAGVLEALASLEGRLRVVSSRLLYGSTRTLLDRMKALGLLEVRYAGPPWEELLEAVEEEKPSLVLVETIGNPTLRVPPLPRLSRLCRSVGCRLLVDNTFASPYLYQPLSLGDHVIVVESLTKYIGGHNDVLGGAACGLGEELLEPIWQARRLTGTILQPLEAYLAARGLKTLHLRMERASRTAMELARAVEESGLASRVYYPGLESHPDHSEARSLLPGLYGGVVSIEVPGCAEAAKRMLSSLRIVVPGPSLGGVESIAAYPYESSHRGLSEEEKRRLGITPGLVRISVGLEDPGDLVEDVLAALRAATGRG